MLVVSVFARATGWMLGASFTFGRCWLALELLGDPCGWELRAGRTGQREDAPVRGAFLQAGPLRLELERFRGRR